MLLPREHLAFEAPVPQEMPCYFITNTHPPEKLLTLIYSFLVCAIGKEKTYRIPQPIKGGGWSNMQHRQNLSWFRRLRT